MNSLIEFSLKNANLESLKENYSAKIGEALSKLKILVFLEMEFVNKDNFEGDTSNKVRDLVMGIPENSKLRRLYLKFRYGNLNSRI